MADFDLEGYIKQFAPELQEKAKACGSVKELLELADKNNVELTPDALEAVSGGVCDNDDCTHRGYGFGYWDVKMNWDTNYLYAICRCNNCKRVFYAKHPANNDSYWTYVPKSEYESF